MGYVVSAVEHLRDGEEAWGKLFCTKEQALEYIDKRLNGFCGGNMTFQLFELGKEVPLKFDKVMEAQPPKEVKRTVMAVSDAKDKRGKGA